jgi:hypothetical protein
MRFASSWVGLAIVGAFGPAACGDDTAATGAGGQGATTAASGTGGAAEGGGGAAPITPGDGFDRFCGEQAWDAALVPVTEGALTGEYVGVIAEPLP